MGEETDRALAREAIRVYRRYAVEIVEALSFCPYAQRAREEAHTLEVPILDALPTDAQVLAVIEQIGDDPSIDIGLVIFPRLALSRQRLGHWVELLRKAHAASHAGTAVLAIEGFHPDAEADLSSPQRLTPFVRRCPDPTLQLTRLDTLEKVRRGSPTGTAFMDMGSVDVAELLARPQKRPLHARIAELNHEQVTRLGVDAVREKMDDILRDRDAAYAAIDPSVPRRL